jgi:hypothetical protein
MPNQYAERIKGWPNMKEKVIEVKFLLYHGIPSVELVMSNGKSDVLPLSKPYAMVLRDSDLATHGTFVVE